MKAVFADAFYYFTLLNPNDETHAAARDFTAGLTGTMLTTAWVLTEVGDGLARVPNRPRFLRLVSDLRSDPDVNIVPPDADLFEKGLS